MFAVFGVSRIKCKAKAEKLVESQDAANKRAYTLEEYTDLLDSKTQELFDSAKSQRISEIYPSREIAEEYLERVKEAGTARDLRIKRRTCAMNEDGTPKINEQTGKQVGVKWVHA
jgi:hypothetical protein